MPTLHSLQGKISFIFVLWVDILPKAYYNKLLIEEKEDLDILLFMVPHTEYNSEYSKHFRKNKTDHILKITYI